MKLNLETNSREQELVKAYLEENASETLAEKINNGTPFEKDEKTLISYQQKDFGRLYEIRIRRGKETCLERCKFRVRRR